MMVSCVVVVDEIIGGNIMRVHCKKRNPQEKILGEERQGYTYIYMSVCHLHITQLFLLTGI